MRFLKFFFERNFIFFKFLLVGLFASIINLLCFFILFYKLNIYEALSYSISYVTGVVIGYIFNKQWSFNYKKKSNRAIFSKYLIVYTINLFVGMGVFELVLIMSNIEELLVQAIVIIITAVSNFIGLKMFVFR